MIQQLQLPPLINVPQLDQTALGQIGDTIAAYRQRSDLANALPSILGQPAQQPTSQGNSLANLGQPAPSVAAQPSGNGLTQDQMALLAGAARKYGIDPNYLVQVASLEGTGKNPASTAQGLGQFIDSTAKQYGVVRGNDASAADALARFTLDNSAALTKALGRTPTPGELYLAHQQGAAGAAKLIGSPNSPASALVGSPAIVNNGGAPNETASQFTSPYLQRFANLPPAITNGAQPATSQPGGAGMQPSPTATPTQPPQQQPTAAPQSTATSPAIASSPALQGIRPDVLARLQAMIRAGGTAQQFAMAALQKYVVPQQPIIVPEGGTAVNPLTGAVVARGQPKSYSVAAGGELVTPGAPGAGGTPGNASSTYQNTNGLMSDNAIALQAQRAMSGDFSVFSQSGRGNIGQINNAAIVNWMADHGATPEQLNLAKTQLEGLGAAQKTLGTQEAKVGSAAFEAGNAINLARGAIDKVSRTNSFGPLNSTLNQLKELYDEHRLNPDQTELYTRAQAVINTYATVMSRNGAPTDAARAHAEKLLDTAGNADTWNRALDTLTSEINMAKTSPEQMRQFYRDQYSGKSEQPASAQPTKTATEKTGVPTFSTPRDVLAAMKSGKLKSGDRFTTPDGQIRIAK